MSHHTDLIDENDWEDLASPDGDRHLDLMQVLQRRKWIVITFGLLGLLVGVLYYVRADRVYESTAQVMIEHKQTSALPIASIDASLPRSYWDTEVQKHPIVIRSPQVLDLAVRNERLDQLKCLRPPGGGDQASSPVKTLIENLNVVPVDDGVGIYNISMRGGDPEEVGQIVNAVVDTYERFLETTHDNVDLETQQLITKAKDELQKQLKLKEQAYEQFRETSPVMLQGADGTNLHQQRQDKIEADRTAALLQLSQLESELAAMSMSAAMDEEQQGDQMYALLAAADNSFLNTLTSRLDREVPNESLQSRRDREMLLPLLLEEKEAVSRYGDDHPKVKSIRRRIEYSKTYYKSIVGIDLEHPENNDPAWDAADSQQKRRELMFKATRAYVDSRKQLIQQLRDHTGRLDKLFEAEEKKAKELVHFQVKDENFRNDIERTQQLFDMVLKRFDELNLVGNREGYNFQRLAQAGIGQKVAPSLAKTFAIAGLLGGMLGFGLGYLLELTDKSFHSPLEISQRLRLPVVAHVPAMNANLEIGPELARYAAVLCTLHASNSQSSEAYRAVRTALYFSSRGKRHQVIQVSSPRPGDGKSTLAANLAIAIANSGKSVLLVDADFRRPTLHKLFGLDRRVGFANLIEQTDELHDACQPIPDVPHLSVLPCGRRPDKPSEMVSSAAFSSALDYLREQYEFVIVDTPPLLAVSDPGAIAAQVDGVILITRLHRELRPTLTRACDMLREIGAEIIGIVINGVDSTESGGYSYSYGYSRSRYGYQAEKYGYIYGAGYQEGAEVEKLEAS